MKRKISQLCDFNFREKLDSPNLASLETVCEALVPIRKKMGVECLTLLKQVHGFDGHPVKNKPQNSCLDIFAREGDFLITNKPGFAICVLTADCLPIILYDRTKHACGAVHAGWRGSVKKIAPRAVAKMQETYGTNPRDVIAYFGPSAKRCCYEVGKGFSKNLVGHALARLGQDVIFKRSVAGTDRFFFDNVKLNEMQLVDSGLLPENILLEHNLCTMCDSSLYSYRRDGERAGRQLAIVSLKKM